MFRHGFAAITAVSLALAAALGVASLARADDTISATPSHLAPNASPDAETRVAFVSRPGLYGPADGIAVANLTVQPGQYVVEYTFEYPR